MDDITLQIILTLSAGAIGFVSAFTTNILFKYVTGKKHRCSLIIMLRLELDNVDKSIEPNSIITLNIVKLIILTEQIEYFVDQFWFINLYALYNLTEYHNDMVRKNIIDSKNEDLKTNIINLLTIIIKIIEENKYYKRKYNKYISQILT